MGFKSASPKRCVIYPDSTCNTAKIPAVMRGTPSRTHTHTHSRTHTHTCRCSTWPRILPIACSTHQLTGGGVRTRRAAPRLVARSADAALDAAMGWGMRGAGRTAVLWRHHATAATTTAGRRGDCAQRETGPGTAALRIQLEEELKTRKREQVSTRYTVRITQKTFFYAAYLLW